MWRIITQVVFGVKPAVLRPSTVRQAHGSGRSLKAGVEGRSILWMVGGSVRVLEVANG